jgi:hypothetical protein
MLIAPLLERNNMAFSKYARVLWALIGRRYKANGFWIGVAREGGDLQH